MSDLLRFFSLGARDLDRRAGDAMAPPQLDDADRYLRESTIARLIDRATRVLATAWSRSRTASTCALLVARPDWADSYRAIGVPLVVAVVVHVLLTLMQGSPRGWFWLVVPALTAVFAVVVVAAASAGTRSTGQRS